MTLGRQRGCTPRCVALPPSGGTYLLANAHVPAGCIQGGLPLGAPVCIDNLAEVDIQVVQGKVASLHPASAAASAAGGHAGQRASSSTSAQGPVIDLRGKMVLPTFADLHTHIGEP